jgi:molybdate transport repressor ModE-like protein
MQHGAYRQPDNVASRSCVAKTLPGAYAQVMRTPAGSRPAARRAAPRLLQPRVKGWLSLGGEFLMGPRYVSLLEGIDETGSITAACRRIGISYRTCLYRLKQMEAVMGHALVLRARGGAGGGGAALTEEARHLVRVYRRWRGRLQERSDRAFREAERASSRGSGR